MHGTYRWTLYACYCGSVVEAIAIHLPSLLFLSFRETYGLELTDLATLLLISFSAQLFCDLFASRFAGRLSMRGTVLFAHFAVFVGLILMALLPHVLSARPALLCSVAFLGCGGGLLEVYVSSIIEAFPLDRKAGRMSMLHSFYCWGHVGVILLSALFFWIEPRSAWRCLLPLFWSVVPLFGFFAFLRVPLLQAWEEGTLQTESTCLPGLFWLFAVMMFCGGAAEQTVAQWASGFAESTLGLSKTVGDLLCPGAFALMMAIGRLWYGNNCHRVTLSHLLSYGCGLTLVGLLLSSLAAPTWLALLGCVLSGLGVSVFWPAILSGAAESKGGGVRLFSLLALAGDLGCMGGPFLSGLIAESSRGELRSAFLFATVFPILQLSALRILRWRRMIR